MALCLSVCLSVTRRYCIDIAERTELVFCIEAMLGLSYIAVEGNSAISKNKGISVLNFVPNSGLKKNFATATARQLSQLVSLVGCSALINWQWSSFASLSHCTPTFVYNTMGKSQRDVRSVCGSWDLLLTLPVMCFVEVEFCSHQLTDIRRPAAKCANNCCQWPASTQCWHSCSTAWPANERVSL